MVAEVGVTYQFPAYLGRKDETVALKTPDLEAPQYTVAQLRIRPTVPVTKGYIQLDGKKYPGHVQDGGKLVEAKIPLLQNGSYTIHLFVRDKLTDDAPAGESHSSPSRPAADRRTAEARPRQHRRAGRRSAGDDPRRRRLRHRPDEVGNEGRKRARAPRIRPRRDASRMPITRRPPDEAGDATVTTVKTWDDFKNETAPVRQHRLELKPEEIKPGQTVLLRAVAWDKRSLDDWGLSLKPQETATPWHGNQNHRRGRKELRRLGRLGKPPQRHLEDSGEANPRPDRRGGHRENRATRRSHRRSPATSARSRSTSRKSSAELVKSLAPSDNEERQTIKRVLNGLAFGDMLAGRQAVRRTGEAQERSAEFDEPVGELLATQDQIIDVLRKLLDVVAAGRGRSCWPR